MIKLLLSDVDGVMTDGGVTYDEEGRELKKFNIRDGLGIRLWEKSGGLFGIVTGRSSSIVEQRARELGVAIIRQGVSEKLPVVEEIAKQKGVAMEEIAYVGDDLPDLPVIRAVGLGAAAADACEEVRAGADLVLQTKGGRGVVRELVEHVLKQEAKWEPLVKRFY